MENLEILSNLKALGLDAGATIEDIHSSFRKLAREHHPDVTGSKSDYRFKQITSAYTALKNITEEELRELENFMSKIAVNKPRLKRDIYDYYSAEKKRRADDEKIDSILDKYEEQLKSFSAAPKNDDLDLEALTMRLKSKNPKVVNVALKHSGPLVNRVEFRLALAEYINRPASTITDELANILSSLPLEDTTKKLLALDVYGNAQKFPTGLIIALLVPDTDVIEGFLLHAKPDDVAVILRRWPAGKPMNTSVIRKLLDSNDARVLVPLLGAMKTHFPSLAMQHTKRLWELERHSTAAVRAWAKKLT